MSQRWFNGAAPGAFQAPDATGRVRGLVEFDSHRTPAAAEIALGAGGGFEAEVKQAPAVEQCQQPAQRTKYTAPRAMNINRPNDKCRQNPCLEPAHDPSFASQQILN